MIESYEWEEIDNGYKLEVIELRLKMYVKAVSEGFIGVYVFDYAKKKVDKTEVFSSASEVKRELVQKLLVGFLDVQARLVASLVVN